MGMKLDLNSPKWAESAVGMCNKKTLSGISLINTSELSRELLPDQQLINQNLKVTKGGMANNGFREQLADHGVILIDGVVGEDFTEQVIWPFARMLNDNNIPSIKLLINSYGGMSTHMFQLISMIRNSTKPVTAEIVMAMSAAFLIANQCHYRVAHAGANLMWHKCWSVYVGNQDQVSRQSVHADFSDKYAEQLLLERSSITLEDLKNHDAKDWYMTAKTALRLGVIDSVIPDRYVLDPKIVEEMIKIQQKITRKMSTE